MDDEEAKLRRRMLDGPAGWAVEAAYEYACLLEARGRLREAVRVLEDALREGPDWARAASSRACRCSTTCARHGCACTSGSATSPRLRGRSARRGQRESFAADWAAVLAGLDAPPG